MVIIQPNVFNKKARKTTTKEFKNRVRKTILAHFDSLKSARAEIEHYKRNFGYNYGETMCQYGCFDCYYSQCEESMANWFNITIDEVWAYYNEDTDRLWENYKHFIKRELEHI